MYLHLIAVCCPSGRPEVEKASPPPTLNTSPLAGGPRGTGPLAPIREVNSANTVLGSPPMQTSWM